MSVWTLEQAVRLYGDDRRGWLAEPIAPFLRRFEIACRCGCGNADISTGLIYLWTAIRLPWGKPLLWSSGCRCLSHNRAVYQAQGLPPNDHTRHLTEVAQGILGRAGDLITMDPADWAAFGRFLHPIVADGGLGRYAERRFHHVDTGESEDLRSRRKSRWEG